MWVASQGESLTKSTGVAKLPSCLYVKCINRSYVARMSYTLDTSSMSSVVRVNTRRDDAGRD